MKNLYQSKSKIIQYDGKIKKTLKNEEMLYEIKKNKENEITYYKITNKTDYQEISSDISFKRHFYNEVSKEFTPLKIEYENDTFVITNKKDLINKLDKKTFDYFRKYPSKALEVNTILTKTKEGLKLENLEAEIEEESILQYLFKFDKIKKIRDNTLESESLEIIYGWGVPTTIEYKIQSIDDKRIKINFKEILDNSRIKFEKFKEILIKLFEIPVTSELELEFFIEGYYIYNEYEDILEQIEVNKEIKLFNITTVSKRTLELLEILEIDENKRNQGRTYDEAVGELFEYLDKIGRKKEIDRQEFENFVDGIAFSEKSKIFETLKWYIETNKIGFLELLEGERDRIYISKEDVLKVLEEIFGEL